MEKIEEKYREIFNDRERAVNEKNKLLNENRMILNEKSRLANNLGVANRQSEEVQNKFKKFTGKILHNCLKIFDNLLSKKIRIYLIILRNCTKASVSPIDKTGERQPK